ncbi:hypothetical protein WA158_005169 [Blastocystis sp. Blastoise]
MSSNRSSIYSAYPYTESTQWSDNDLNVHVLSSNKSMSGVPYSSHSIHSSSELSIIFEGSVGSASLSSFPITESSMSVNSHFIPPANQNQYSKNQNAFVFGQNIPSSYSYHDSYNPNTLSYYSYPETIEISSPNHDSLHSYPIEKSPITNHIPISTENQQEIPLNNNDSSYVLSNDFHDFFSNNNVKNNINNNNKNINNNNNNNNNNNSNMNNNNNNNTNNTSNADNINNNNMDQYIKNSLDPPIYLPEDTYYTSSVYFDSNDIYEYMDYVEEEKKKKKTKPYSDPPAYSLLHLKPQQVEAWLIKRTIKKTHTYPSISMPKQVAENSKTYLYIYKYMSTQIIKTFFIITDLLRLYSTSIQKLQSTCLAPHLYYFLIPPSIIHSLLRNSDDLSSLSVVSLDSIMFTQEFSVYYDFYIQNMNELHNKENIILNTIHKISSSSSVYNTIEVVLGMVNMDLSTACDIEYSLILEHQNDISSLFIEKKSKLLKTINDHNLFIYYVSPELFSNLFPSYYFSLTQ